MGAVQFHGFRRNRQGFGDALVGQPRDHRFEGFPLARGEPGQAFAQRQAGGLAGLAAPVPGDRLLHGFDQGVVVGGVGKEVLGAGAHRSDCRADVGAIAEEYY